MASGGCRKRRKQRLLLCGEENCGAADSKEMDYYCYSCQKIRIVVVALGYQRRRGASYGFVVPRGEGDDVVCLRLGENDIFFVLFTVISLFAPFLFLSSFFLFFLLFVLPFFFLFLSFPKLSHSLFFVPQLCGALPIYIGSTVLQNRRVALQKWCNNGVL